jgi:glycine cleavage system H protein
MQIPDDLLYTKDHEWVRIEGALATMGITDYAQDSLGDITFIDVPKPGAKVEQSKWCATVESVKAASDVYAPVSGTVRTSNDTLSAHPETVNKAPYSEGWFAVIEMSDPKEAAALMTPAAYKKYVEGLAH